MIDKEKLTKCIALILAAVAKEEKRPINYGYALASLQALKDLIDDENASHSDDKQTKPRGIITQNPQPDPTEP